MRHDWLAPDASEDDVRRLAQRIALKLGRGDTIALSGDLGAGKTTFARHLIRALVGQADAEVPSPTFSLVQTYDTPRLVVAHVDLYRITHEGEAVELGIDEMARSGAMIIEWPERAPALLGLTRLDIRLSEGSSEGTRRIAMTGWGSWAAKLERLQTIAGFLDGLPDWREADVTYLQGDASARAYARLGTGEAHHAVLMDAPRQPDGPPIRDGLPYSRIAHLAEDVRPFVAVAGALRAAGLSVPEIYAADLDAGLIVLEDFGDQVFARALEAGYSQSELWLAATDVLASVARLSVPGALPLPDGSSYRLPAQDRGVLEIETALLPDWYWPAVHGSSATDGARTEFAALWGAIFDRLLALPAGWTLRDYHSPNLMWLPDRRGVARVGILDFQDALSGPPAYDLVSLLQDARLDVPADLEAVMFAHYCSGARQDRPRFDEDALRFAYAALGAQRNTKIVGIFARLAHRDGKPSYLRHLPRIWRYLERDLAHPELAGLRAWYDRNFPDDARRRLA